MPIDINLQSSSASSTLTSTMPTTQTPLSVREAAFVRHYLAGRSGVRGNGTQAAIAAGYAPRAAGVQAHALLKRPRIQRAVAARCAKADITVNRVLEELRRVAFSDLGDVATWGPDGIELKASDGLPDDVAPAVAEVVEHRTTSTTTRPTPAVGEPGEPSYQPPGEITTVTEERNLRVKLHDKIKALTTISKYLGILKDRSEEVELPLLPKGFFAAVITGDIEKIKGFLPEGTSLSADCHFCSIGPSAGPAPVPRWVS